MQVEKQLKYYDSKLYLMSENLNDQVINNETDAKVSVEKSEKKLSVADEILQRIAAKTGKTYDVSELAKSQPEKKEEKIVAQETQKVEEKKQTIDEIVATEVPAYVSMPETEDYLEEEEEQIQVESVDYSKFSKSELAEKLRQFISEGDVNAIRNDVEGIKQSFYKIHNAELKVLSDEFDKKNQELPEEERTQFVAEPDKLELEVKELLKLYKNARAEFVKNLEKEKEENLAKKNAIIEKINYLINKEEAFNDTFNEFRLLQQEWREIGLVPQNSVKELWDNYHKSVESFYDYVKINNALRDLDLKKNLETKTKLCDDAEGLLLEPNVVTAFKRLQDLHELWREAGPVPSEKKDELWERFKRVTTQINKNHQDHFELLKEEQMNNLKAKTLICEKVDEINALEMDSIKDWDDKSKEIIELQKIWRLIGFAPKKENNTIYQRFREACDLFFQKKRTYFDGLKNEQTNNLQLKIDLCVQAESLKESFEWKKVTDEFIALQKRWKEIGPVPRKQSDIVWKRFRAACDYFFNKKSEHFNSIDKVQDENLKLKLEIIEKIRNFNESESIEQGMQTLKDLQNEWLKIGHVPFDKKDQLISDFRKELDAKFGKINMNQKERNSLKFKQKIETLSNAGGGQAKMKGEREKLVKLLQKITNDIITLENNIGFFANTKNADALIQDVKNQIVTSKQKADEIKQKISMIDSSEA